MRHSLFFRTKPVLAISLAVLLCGVYAPGMPVLAASLVPQHPPVIYLETASASTNESLIAHHGGEGAGASSAGAISAAPLLSAGVSQSVNSATITDSLWGNLLIGMAVQRDPEIQRLAKKLGRVNTMTLLSVVGVSALGLAASISSLGSSEAQTVDVMQHGGGHAHVHIPGESRTPATLGIIGSSTTIATLGIRALMNRRYGNKLEARQNEIKKQVVGIINRLEAGTIPPESTRADLAALVGPRAAGEFLQLWAAAHPAPN